MASPLDHDRLQHVASLARLRLSEDELARYGAQFAEILSAFEGLQRLDLSGVPELHQVTGLENCTVADIPARSVDRDAMLASSRRPKQQDQIVVPSPHGTNG